MDLSSRFFFFCSCIHQLRHSRASQLLQAGVPVTTVRKQLGLRNIQSTLLYVEVDQATIKQDLLNYQRHAASAETEAVSLLEEEKVIPVQLSLLAEEEKDP